MYPAGIVRDSLIETDISRVVELQQAVMPNPWSQQSFKSSLQAGDGCYVLKRASEIIAVAVVSQVLDEAELLTIAVTKDEQGKGLASAFLADLMALLAGQSIKRCMLEVMEHNAPAKTVYKRIGFREVAVRKGYYRTPDGVFDATVMRLDY